MKVRMLSLFALATASVIASAATTPSAASVVSRAEKLARAEHKNVLVDFRASWCPWCKRFEELLQDPKFGPKFKASYVIASVTVREDDAHKNDENLGWEPIMAKYRKVKDQDIPYIVILNGEGGKLGDSYEPAGQRIPNNAGFPQTNDEIEAYLKLIRRTAPSFSEQDLSDLKLYFIQVRSKPSGH